MSRRIFTLQNKTWWVLENTVYINIYSVYIIKHESKQTMNQFISIQNRGLMQVIEKMSAV